MTDLLIKIPGPPTVSFGVAPRGRVTGWAVACTEHGAMPVLAPGRSAARRAADLHAKHEHGGVARVLERKARARG